MTFCYNETEYKFNMKIFFSCIIISLIVSSCVLGLFFTITNAQDVYNEASIRPTMFNADVGGCQNECKAFHDYVVDTQQKKKAKSKAKKRTQKMPIVSDSAIKRYEDRTKITCRTSKAYELCNTHGVVVKNGFVKCKDRYLVAMGQSYGQTGDKFDITLKKESGEKHVLKVVLGDVKKDEHTVNGEGYYCDDGHVIEGIVDTESLPDQAKTMGDLNYTAEFNGEILEIKKVD